MSLRIGNTSKLFLQGNKISVIIRPSAISMSISSIIIFVCGFIVGVWLFHSDSIKDKSSLILVLAGIYPFYSFSYKEISEINLTERSLIKRKRVLGVCFYKYVFAWQESCYFSYEIVYNSYQHVNSTWVILRYKEQKVSKKLIRFTETNSFFEFQKIFNKKFPEYKILEWHD